MTKVMIRWLSFQNIFWPDTLRAKLTLISVLIASSNFVSKFSIVMKSVLAFYINKHNSIIVSASIGVKNTIINSI